MRILSKWFALIALILGISMIAVMLISKVEICIFRPQYRTSYYDIITLITSSDFDQYPYSKLDLAARVCPLICTILLTVATGLAVFYKNKKCVIPSGILILISWIALLIARYNLTKYNYTVNLDEYIAVFDNYFYVTAFSNLMLLSIMCAHFRHRQENNLGPMI